MELKIKYKMEAGLGIWKLFLNGVILRGFVCLLRS